MTAFNLINVSNDRLTLRRKSGKHKSHSRSKIRSYDSRTAQGFNAIDVREVPGFSGDSRSKGHQPVDLSESVFEHALAFFGSRILHPARPALRDADVAELFDVTREDLEHQTSLPFADAVEVLDFLVQHRHTPPGEVAPAPAFTGHKYEYAVEQLGYLAGTDLYDAYIEGRLTTAALRKLFLTHIEEPGVARATYIQLRKRLRQRG